MPDTVVTFGPPGTGKTRTMLDVVDREIGAGILPSRIAFVSFTRRSIEEASGRARTRFGLSEDDLPWFRTLHSAAYRAKGLRSDAIMTTSDYARFGEAFGVSFSAEHSENEIRDQPLETATVGDTLLSLYAWAAAVRVDADAAALAHQIRGGTIGAPIIRKFFLWYAAFKADCHKIDFADMLDDVPPIDVDVAIIDEAQDCTPQQWEAVRAMFSGARRWYVAGDDDQAIYRWAGAEPSLLAALPGSKRVLSRSMRIPRAIHEIATSVIARCDDRRVPKQWYPRDEAGAVTFCHVASWDPGPRDSGTWLVLARTRRSLAAARVRLEHLGVPYLYDGVSCLARPGAVAIRSYERLRRGESVPWGDFLIMRRHISVEFGAADDDRPESVAWSDLDWPESVRGRSMTWLDAVSERIMRVPDRDVSMIRRIRERGEKLSDAPRVSVSTIHGAKGAESDHVLLMTDTSRSAARSTDQDDEHRTFYVGVTRARRTLAIVPPTRYPYYSL